MLTYSQLASSDAVAVSMTQQRDQREMKAIWKVIEVAGEAYEGLPINS